MDEINAIPHLQANLRRKKQEKSASTKKPGNSGEKKSEAGHLPEPGHKIDTRA